VRKVLHVMPGYFRYGPDRARRRRATRDFGLMASITFSQYFVLTVNFRAIAHAQYLVAGLTAATAALFAYFVVRRIAKAETWHTAAGSACGGALADVAGIWVTRAWGA
jgi:hypothetical protein